MAISYRHGNWCPKSYVLAIWWQDIAGCHKGRLDWTEGWYSLETWFLCHDSYPVMASIHSLFMKGFTWELQRLIGPQRSEVLLVLLDFQHPCLPYEYLITPGLHTWLNSPFCDLWRVSASRLKYISPLPNCDSMLKKLARVVTVAQNTKLWVLADPNTQVQAKS